MPSGARKGSRGRPMGEGAPAFVDPPAGPGAGAGVPVQRGSLRCSASSHGPETSSVVEPVAVVPVVAPVVVAPVDVAPGSDTVRAGSLSRPVAAAQPPLASTPAPN